MHFHDGPIDLILEAFGAIAEIAAARHAAAQRFATILDELCDELPLLRAAAQPGGKLPSGCVARRMAQAVAPFAIHTFITPMAAVAGAVAEEILQTMTSAASLPRAYVNDGGDIALHLSAGESFRIGMIERPDRPSLFGTVQLDARDPVRGIATSGWRGRSFSLGIADAVTVLADRAAAADAAATMIVNAVDLPAHPAIIRVPARNIAPDNDLGDRLVTRDVGALNSNEIDAALASGVAVATEFVAHNLICAAALCLQGETRVVGAACETGKFTASAFAGISKKAIAGES
jgi:ApbE superfamily uncharacterized protein (UPF0280 family)